MSENIRIQECCYLSTPEHVRSFIGRFIYIYTAKGKLHLTSESIIFTSPKTSLNIPISLIKDINTGNYSRFAKPLRLDYIAIKYESEEGSKAILLTPTQSWATPVWQTNKLVASWTLSLKGIVHKQ
jgi:hypothetical protein